MFKLGLKHQMSHYWVVNHCQTGRGRNIVFRLQTPFLTTSTSGYALQFKKDISVAMKSKCTKETLKQPHN